MNDRLQSLAEGDDAPAMSWEKMEKLLEPLLDTLMCQRSNLTNLRKNHGAIIARMYDTGFPVLLRIQHQSLLLCDPKAFFELENRRRWVLQGCKTVEQLLRIGKIKLPDKRIGELEFLKTQIAEEKKTLEDLEWSTKQVRKNLSQMQAAADALSNALRRRFSKGKAPKKFKKGAFRET